MKRFILAILSIGLAGAAQAQVAGFPGINATPAPPTAVPGFPGIVTSSQTPISIDGVTSLPLSTWAQYASSKVVYLSRLANAALHDNVRLNPAMTGIAWSANANRGAGDIVSNGGVYYENEMGLNCTTAGSGGPSGSSANIVDGGCIWKPSGSAVVTNLVTPTLTMGIQWGTSQTYLTGATVVTYTGSGATALGNFYTLTGTSPCVSAGSGGGPTGTGTGITDGTCTWNFSQSVPTAIFSNSGPNSYLWNGGAGTLLQHVNAYGGVVGNSGGTSYMRMLGPTVAGTKAVATARYEFITDSQKFVIRTYELSGTNPTLQSAIRIIVCNIVGAQCQYVNATPISTQPSVPGGGWARTIVDFSSVGGHEPRDIIIENDAGTDFGGIDILATEDLYQPSGAQPLSMAVSGDSYPSGGGLYWGTWLSFPNLMADHLGIRNVINTAIGGTGYLTSNASGTAISRISDVTTANNGKCPDVLLIGNGSNDVSGFTPTQIAAAQTTYINTFRAACGTQVPIIAMGLWAHNNGGLSWTAGVAAETAMQAAAAAMNDPLLLFVPVVNDPSGTWMTGTGVIGNAVGTATFATNQMTVTATTSGAWQIGGYVTAAGVSAGTTITAFGTGTGQNGTYTLSTSPGTISSEAVTMTGQNGTGNTDFMLEGRGSPPNLHPNAFGNRYFANRLSGAIRNWLAANKY